jgi:hypothetical protein
MPQLVKRAPPYNKKKPTTSAWDHQRQAMTRLIVKEIVIARHPACTVDRPP